MRKALGSDVFHLLVAILVTSPKHDNEGQKEKRKKVESCSLDMSEDVAQYSGGLSNLVSPLICPQ